MTKNVLNIFFRDDVTCHVVSSFNRSRSSEKDLKGMIATINSDFGKMLKKCFSKTRHLYMRIFAAVFV